VLKQRSTADNYLNFLTKKLTLLMADVPLQTRRGVYLQHDGAPPHIGREVTAHLNRRYENRWIGRRDPVTWLPRSPDLLISFYGV
jgi:hypothetical protein